VSRRRLKDADHGYQSAGVNSLFEGVGRRQHLTMSVSERLGRIGVDWWATIVAGIVVLLAVAGLLPRIPW
jgi:hypothetical protein